VVDDEPDIIKVLMVRLREQGYETSSALDAKQAWAQIEQNVPDLIILDIMMPGISGHEIAQKLKADRELCHIPIIFLSGLQTKDGERTQGKVIGGNVILAKPFEMAVLLENIKEMIP